MAPFEGDNWVSPFGMERNPETLVSRAIFQAHQLLPVSSFAAKEYVRLVSEYGDPTEGVRGVGSFETVCADLVAHGWFLTDNNAAALTPPFEVTSSHVTLWMDSTQSANGTASMRVRLPAAQVYEFMNDLERSGHWTYAGHMTAPAA